MENARIPIGDGSYIEACNPGGVPGFIIVHNDLRMDVRLLPDGIGFSPDGRGEAGTEPLKILRDGVVQADSLRFTGRDSFPEQALAGDVVALGAENQEGREAGIYKKGDDGFWSEFG